MGFIYTTDMIFSDDAILLSFFTRYEGEEDELKEAIVKYSRGGVMESNRPAGIQAVKGGDTDEMDMVINNTLYNNMNRQVQLTVH